MKNAIGAGLAIFLAAHSAGGDASVQTASKLQPGRADLVVEDVRVSPSRVNNVTSGELSFTVRNRGTQNATATATGYYLSSDYSLSDDDRLLGSIGMGAIGRGASAVKSLTVRIPITVAPGRYYLLVKADDRNQLMESDNANNIGSAPMTVTAHARPDLSVRILSVEPPRQARGGSVKFRYQVTNGGDGPVPGFRTKSFYSEDRVITPADHASYVLTHGTGIEPHRTRELSGYVNIPASATSGDHFIGVIVDDDDAIPESDESNNTASFPFYVMSEGLPDLRIVSLRGPTGPVAPGAIIPFTCRIHNAGTAVARRPNVSFMISSDRSLDDSDRYIGSLYPVALAAGASFDLRNSQLRLPAGIGIGFKYLLAVADARGELTEESESNNMAYCAFTISGK